MKILLTQNQVALVDEDDWELVREDWWSAVKIGRTYYANNRHQYLHRRIVQCPIGFEIDHINGDGLDNRKTNLQIVTHQDNLKKQRISLANTSGIRGVSYRKDKSCWEARVKVNNKNRRIGYFKTKEEAANAVG